ncbi:MAG: HD-GYP domain-containing protein [Chloroflexi bacterium]|nr:HD-GYP domain-containing protein [Chloroflexota bacterium]
MFWPIALSCSWHARGGWLISGGRGCSCCYSVWWARRVTRMTVLLAEKVGVLSGEMPHIWRGALLHDIGRIGVPDAILHKTGSLTEEEWGVMHTHPQLARDWLNDIAYLRKAIPIPWCHHEKWDGSGYPQGLKGEQIPLAARIFAVVDVYDALTYDRSYRAAWTKEKALAYIREQAGKHFDPKAATAFLQMIAEQTEA